MKKYLILGLIIGLLVAVGGVLAAKPTPIYTVTPSGDRATVAIPDKAYEVAPNVFYLGTAVDNGKIVEGYAFIDYKKEFAKPPSVGGKGVAACYGFLAKGAKWKTTEPYVVGDVDAVATARDLETWDSQVPSFEIFGSQGAGSVDGADTITPDDKNEIMFGDISSPGAIAVAIVWGIFSGPPSTRELVEYDVVFDNVDYNWYDCTQTSCTSENKGMDFENIATHELGHAAGMADLYPSQCSEQTMYGYAAPGETKKRDLDTGDIKGVQELYK